MTNGRGAGMASFMTKKKKYKFQVDICLEELLEVPFVSAVLFAKLRLLDGGNFQDYSSREEVRDHKVKWGAKFSFPCKMLANASNGVLEKCILRISVRKESKGGRSFNKLGFVDLNLAEFAGAGIIYKKALLEGYDARRRQDNSMLKFSIVMHMLSGDILFKVPSPSLKHKSIATDEQETEQRQDEFSSGSLGGSIASGSSGFGSLPKKRTPLLNSELVIGTTLSENKIPSIDIDNADKLTAVENEDKPSETGHSRNSSNTSQLSKASGYSSIHSQSHSRQSSSGDSGHIRGRLSARTSTLTKPILSTPFNRTKSFPNRIKLPSRIPSNHKETIFTLENLSPESEKFNDSAADDSIYSTPKGLLSQTSNSSTDDYKTPETSLIVKNDVFAEKFNELQKSFSTSVVENYFSSQEEVLPNERDSRATHGNLKPPSFDQVDGVCRSKSEYEIPTSKIRNSDQLPDNLYSFLTPRPQRKGVGFHSTPKGLFFPNDASIFKIPSSSILTSNLNSLPENKAPSLNSLQCGHNGAGRQHLSVQPVRRGMSHRKLFEGSSGGKLAPLAISPDETPTTVSSDCSQNPSLRRPSITTNPSSSSLVLSETGSLDRAKAAYERRKKTQGAETDGSTITGRVENTRVNPDHLIADLLKNTNLEQGDDTTEASGLELFIAKDGTAALGNHEVKSQMSTGVQVFKQVVMDNNR